MEKLCVLARMRRAGACIRACIGSATAAVLRRSNGLPASGCGYLHTFATQDAHAFFEKLLKKHNVNSSLVGILGDSRALQSQVW